MGDGSRDASSRRARRVGAFVGLVVGVLGATIGGTAPAAHAADDTATARLLTAYAPVLVVRSQSAPCRDGEPYRPVAVDAILGRDDVVLRGPGGATVSAPTAADLAAADPASHLDLPGAALRPGCTYERWFRGLGATPTTYARLATDDEHPGRLVAQYWLFYVYNDWNDRHEGDWEMVQVVFDADDPDEALAEGPTKVAYAQHEGAEVSPWTGGQLRVVDGTHPLVYAGAGSHASYFRAARWFGASAASGFGCDDTRAPSTRVDLAVHVVDDADTAWLSYRGRWGEQQPSFNNGPTGPLTKVKWEHPVQWMLDEGRASAVALPASGTEVTDFFCTVSAGASSAFMRYLDQPWVVAIGALAIAVLLVVIVRSTRWRPLSVDPVFQRRAAGQVLRAAASIVRRRWRVFAVIGLVQLLPGAAVAVAEASVAPQPDVSDIVEVVSSTSAWGTVVLLAIGLFVALPTAAVGATASNLVVRALAAGRPVTAREALGGALARHRAIAAQVVTSLVLIGCTSTLVLAPLAAWLAARWAVVAPASIDGPAPWTASRRITDGRRRAALGLALVNATMVIVLPPLVGTVALLLGGWSFTTVNAVATLVSLALYPTAAVVLAVFHGDLVTAGVGSHGADGPVGAVT